MNNEKLTNHYVSPCELFVYFKNIFFMYGYDIKWGKKAF